MRIFTSVLVSLLALGAPVCREEGPAATHQGTNSTNADRAAFAAVTGPQGEPGLKIVPPDRPPPRTTLIRDIKSGSGPIARKGDRVAVYYKGVDYKTGKLQVHAWPPSPPLILQRLGFDGWGEKWEKGIEGMREGGRRELIIPGSSPKAITFDYVVDMVWIDPR